MVYNDKLKNENIFKCPSHVDFSFDSNHLSYGCNYGGGDGSSSTHFGLGLYWAHANEHATKLSQIKHPSRTIAFADSLSDGISTYYVSPHQYDFYVASDRHNGYASVLWCEGHVSKEKAGELNLVSDLWDRTK